MQKVSGDVQDVRLQQRRTQISSCLSPPDPSTNFHKALHQRQEGTGQWLLRTPSFLQWQVQQGSFLWLHGIPGCGKTILSSTIVQHLEVSSSPVKLLYFYFDFNNASKRTLEKMVVSLVSQLYIKCRAAQGILDALYSSYSDGHRRLSSESLCNVFLEMVEQAKEVWLVIDALDECTTRSGPWNVGLLKWISSLLTEKQRNIHLLVTSRPEQDITAELSSIASSKKSVIPLQSDLIKDDIDSYIRVKVRNGEGLRRWRSSHKTQQEIETALVQKADGM